MTMPLNPTLSDIALRLLLTMVAGAIIGFNREAKGHAAGLRTTMLVGLAASVAMIQANLLLPVAGKTSASFAEMDIMRLPLGILTGVGFIGAGAILKRGDLVTGMTTAATLWVMTVIGLCLGGGQIGLGGVATALGVITLWALKWLDRRIPREGRAMIVIELDLVGSSIQEFAEVIAPLGCKARFQGQTRNDTASPPRLCFEVLWKRPDTAGPPIDLWRTLNDKFCVISLELISINE